MTDKPPSQPTNPPSSSKSKAPPSRSSYISSGQMLDSPPLAARFSRFVDSTYNFLGLYLVSLFSLDPYTAAQNSQFNTRGPAGGAARSSTGTGSGGGFFGSRGGSGGSGGGGGGGGAGGPGRRLGTVDDVRGPECGSCG